MENALATENVKIEVSDGTTMDGYLVRPMAAGPHPGIVLFQEIFGVNDHIRDVAGRFAREGYAVLAPDLFHRASPGYIGSYDDIGASIALARKYSVEESVADVKAACEHLRALQGVDPGRIAALGFCMGGRLAFVANAVSKLRAAVSFYGSIAPDKLALVDSLSAPMLLIWAGRDSYITPELHHAVPEALRKANKPFVDVEFSDVNHGFFCDARGDYDAAAAAQAWPLTLAFLRAYLGG